MHASGSNAEHLVVLSCRVVLDLKGLLYNGHDHLGCPRSNRCKFSAGSLGPGEGLLSPPAQWRLMGEVSHEIWCCVTSQSATHRAVGAAELNGDIVLHITFYYHIMD